MNLDEFLEKLDREIVGVNRTKTQVHVLSTYWSNDAGHIVSAPVTDVGMDENSGSLFIEINKTEVV
jgi:hypothetical protein